jgi:hypothetical protein
MKFVIVSIKSFLEISFVRYTVSIGKSLLKISIEIEEVSS